jgi:hippurate hydrolase
MKAAAVFCVLALAIFAGPGDTAAPTPAQVDAIYPQIEALYLDLHRNPELAFHEQNTAAKLAEGLRALGFEVSTGIGGTGVVGILRNGSGPTVMIRTELDALPVHEETGLPYASRVVTKDASGREVPVMHACGHDIHMATWLGTARLLAASKDRWRGTVMMLGQPAEEIVSGARAMLKDGLFTRFPRPDFALAIHDDSDLPAGKVGYTPGYTLSNANSVDITIYGKGGHGAAPQSTVDPVVIAARTVLALQTIVSREVDPRDPAVVTVGAIHGGTKNNIIPDEVKLQLTVRSYKDEVQQHLLAAIQRIAKAEALAAGAPREPAFEIFDAAHATYNDPKLTERLAGTLRNVLGNENVVEQEPKMASEDFSEYGRAGVPAVMLSVGAVEPAKYAAAKASGTPLPSLHSSKFAPDRELTLKTAIRAETAAALELLGKP